MNKVIKWNEPRELHIGEESCAWVCDWYDCEYKGTEEDKLNPTNAWCNVAKDFVNEWTDLEVDELPIETIKEIGEFFQKYYQLDK